MRDGQTPEQHGKPSSGALGLICNLTPFACYKLRRLRRTSLAFFSKSELGPVLIIHANNKCKLASDRVYGYNVQDLIMVPSSLDHGYQQSPLCQQKWDIFFIHYQTWSIFYSERRLLASTEVNEGQTRVLSAIAEH